jgi:UDP-3-O-[3-hydroxymyristoyl] N-acetylglucosamine deacetylase
MEYLQKTIKNEFVFEGVGLHSGKKVKAVCIPAVEDSGIVLVRTDQFKKPRLKISSENIFSSLRSTNLKKGDFLFRTVEHFLSALYGLGIDNLTVEIDAEEMPVLDGSSVSFIRLLKKAGIKSLSKKRRDYSFKKPFFLSNGNSFFVLLPSDHLKITYFLTLPSVGMQSAVFEEGINDFASDIAPARTFGFWEEVPKLWENNLALGGTLENAVLISKDGSFSSKLRFSNEFARHKVLDFLGDLYLSGFFLKADITAVRTSHAFHAQVLKNLAHL